MSEGPKVILVGKDGDPEVLRALEEAGVRVVVATSAVVKEMRRTREALEQLVARDEISFLPDPLVLHAAENYRRKEESGPDLARRREDKKNLREQLKRAQQRKRGRGKR